MIADRQIHRQSNNSLTDSAGRAETEDADVVSDLGVMQEFDEFVQHDRHGTNTDTVLCRHQHTAPCQHLVVKVENLG